MIAEKLSIGDTIGVISPSHIARMEQYRRIVKTLEGLGFRVKLGANLFKDTHGYLASPEERAGDLNQMALDDEVKMVFFGGGWGSNELLPLIDFNAIAGHPKLYSSYSDGTSILNAIYAKTGLITYYGLDLTEFENLTYYDYTQFTQHFMKGNAAQGLRGNGEWRVLCPGACEGLLIGGYALNFGWLVYGEYFRYDPARQYILFMEDHERFSQVAAVSVYLSHIEQSPFIQNVSGLLFGHYAKDAPPELLARLTRFGGKHGVPVAYTDDFGHFTRHSVLPIGIAARMDTGAQSLTLADRIGLMQL